MLGLTLVLSDLNGDVRDAARGLDEGRRPAVKLFIELSAGGMHIQEDLGGHRGHFWGDSLSRSTAGVRQARNISRLKW